MCAALCAAHAFGAGEVSRDVEFAKIGDLSLKLDVYRPEKARPPLIVYVHGGAWRGGSKKEMPLGALVKEGYAVASVDYRLSTEAQFPAQVHDIKAAIRFLRAQQAQLGIDAARIVIAGSSAGGHLAALVGVTNGHKELEGAVGGHLDQSSDVQGIVS
ncbi:MAG TPA: alpha/beta hydrolase, partial [Chthoniobacteraceae bacterium]|nr:alpha/beta hydrolase [Chthoniobacteraceae bacterium]